MTRVDSLEDILSQLGSSRRQIALSICLLTFTVANWVIEASFSEIFYPVFQCKHGLDTTDTTSIRYVYILMTALGALIFGVIADIRGRAGTLRFALFLSFYFRLLVMTFEPTSLWQQFGSKFMVQFTSGGSLIVALVCFVETLTEEIYHKLALLSIASGMLLGNAVVFATSYINSIYLLVLIQSVPNFMALVFAFASGETIRYLKTSGDFNAVVENLVEIAKSTKQKLPPKLNLRFKNCQFGSLTMLFTKRLAVYTFVLIFLLAILLINNTITYQVYFSSMMPIYNLFRLDNNMTISSYLHGDEYCSYVKMTIKRFPILFPPLEIWKSIFVMLAAGFLAAFKKPLLLLNLNQSLITALLISLSILGQNAEPSAIILYIACKLTVAAPWVLLTYICQLYQTNYRGAGLGLVFFSSSLIYTVLLFIGWSWAGGVGYKLSMIILSAFSAASCILVYLCPPKKVYGV